MRFAPAALVVLLCTTALAADAPARRFGVEADVKTYPQATPEQALASVLKAVGARRADYVLAHLADPQFVDRRVKETSYDDLLAETTARLVNDPGAAKQLRALLEKGTWQKEGDTATVSRKEGDRIASFVRLGDRWFLKQAFKKPVPKTERP